MAISKTTTDDFFLWYQNLHNVGGNCYFIRKIHSRVTLMFVTFFIRFLSFLTSHKLMAEH